MTKYYVVLDLEMCELTQANKKREYHYRNEIIQIGAVMMNDRFEIIDKFDSFVRPEYGTISRFIRDLTGIYDGLVKTAPTIREVLRKMMCWIGDIDVKYVAWSNSDRCQLSREIEAKGINLPGLDRMMAPENWIDYQQIFSERFDMGRAVSLKEALDLTDIEIEGRAHDGLDDAVNTAKLMAKLELDPDFKPIMDLMNSRVEHHDTLAYSMGELFSQDIMAGLS